MARIRLTVKEVAKLKANLPKEKGDKRSTGTVI
jgi:uncharacterized small protein (DUF1192 family)